MKGEAYMEKFTFDQVVEQNKRRIHYHIHKLNIRDPHQDFFQEGLCALWNAYDAYRPEKGPMGTYFNFIIRNRLIDRIRKEKRHQEKKEAVIQATSTMLSDGNQLRRQETAASLQNIDSLPILDEVFWVQMQTHLTANQWKWIRYYVIENLCIKEIAVQEKTTPDAVKSWGRQVRRKLRNDAFRAKIGWDI